MIEITVQQQLHTRVCGGVCVHVHVRVCWKEEGGGGGVYVCICVSIYDCECMFASVKKAHTLHIQIKVDRSRAKM